MILTRALQIYNRCKLRFISEVHVYQKCQHGLQHFCLQLTIESDSFIVVGEHHFIRATAGIECYWLLVLLQPSDDVSGKGEFGKALSASHRPDEDTATLLLEAFTALEHSSQAFP